jgi:hypothetical protein
MAIERFSELETQISSVDSQVPKVLESSGSQSWLLRQINWERILKTKLKFHFLPPDFDFIKLGCDSGIIILSVCLFI